MLKRKDLRIGNILAVNEKGNRTFNIIKLGWKGEVIYIDDNKGFILKDIEGEEGFSFEMCRINCFDLYKTIYKEKKEKRYI